MPAIFQIEETHYKTRGWDEILYSEFLGYLEDIEPLRPEALDTFLSEHYKALSELDKKLTDEERVDKAVKMFSERFNLLDANDKMDCYDFMCIDVGYWCSIDKDLVQEAMNLDQLWSTFWLLQYEMNPSNAEEDETFTGFAANGVEYLLPIKHMTESTVLEFAESAQFQSRMADIEGGNFSAMADVMVVLCRPKGEKYSYSKIKHSNRKKIFLKTTMYNVINTAFFLLRLNKTLKNNFLIYTMQGELQLSLQ